MVAALGGPADLARAARTASRRGARSIRAGPCRSAPASCRASRRATSASPSSRSAAAARGRRIRSITRSASRALAAVGDAVEPQRPLGIVHARSEADADAAAARACARPIASASAPAASAPLHPRTDRRPEHEPSRRRHGWDVAALGRALPRRCCRIATIVVLGEPFDRRAVRYVATWKHPKPGSLAGLPNLEAIFSLGAGVDHLIADPDLPDVPIVRVVEDDLTDRMSEYVVLHCLMHLREQRRYDAPAAREASGTTTAHQPAARRRARRHHGLRRARARTPRASCKMMGFDVAGWSRSPKTVEGFADLCRRGGPDAVPRPHRHPRLPAAADAGHARHPQPPPVRRSSRGTGALGGPILINAGRGGLQVEADILACLDDGTLEGRDPRRVRDRAAAEGLAALDATRASRSRRTMRRRASRKRRPATSRSRSAGTRRASRSRMWSTGRGGIEGSMSSRTAKADPGSGTG